jgi:hypothetical protein
VGYAGTHETPLLDSSVRNFRARPDDYDGQIQREVIQTAERAERAWLRYRDAWVAFARMHYPNTDSNAWLALLAKNRI